MSKTDEIAARWRSKPYLERWEVRAIFDERDRLRAALKCFAHLSAGEVFDGLPDSHLFELVWVRDEGNRIPDEDGGIAPTVTAGQLRRARAALEGKT